MNAMKVVKLIERYANCPRCGHDKISVTGGIEVTVGKFIRHCRCGHWISVTEVDDGGEDIIEEGDEQS